MHGPMIAAYEMLELAVCYPYSVMLVSVGLGQEFWSR